MRTIKSILAFLYDCIKEKRGLFVSALSLIAGLKVFALLMPLYTGKIFDQLNNNWQTLSYLDGNIIIFITIWFATLLLTPLQTYALTKFVQENIYAHSMKWIEIILKKDMHNFDDKQVGRVVHSIERGITAHEKLLGHITTSVIPILLELLISAIILAYLKASTLLVVILLVLMAHQLIVVALIKKRREQLNEVNDAEDEVTGEMVEVLTNGIIFKIEKATEYALSRISFPFKSYAEKSVKLSVSGSFIDNLFYNSSNAVLLLTLFWGIYSIKNNLMSIGHLFTLLAITARLSAAFNQLLQSIRHFDQFSVDIKGLNATLSMSAFDRDGIKLTTAEELKLLPQIITKGLSSFTIEKELTFGRGEKVAVVGATGKGKSSFIEIAAGMRAESRDNVLVDGVSLNKLSSSSHFDLLRYCPQSPYLISGNLAESVFYQDKLEESQKKIFDILDLNHSFQDEKKRIAEKASNISGGEAKRLSLARVINRIGAINIFDEPTTALNGKIKQVVWDLLFSKLSSDLVICTTHDYEELNRFTRVILIDNGKIIHDGPPEFVQKTAEFKDICSAA